jgi:hypothetical protein
MGNGVIAAPFLTSALGRGEWSALRLGCFTPKGNSPLYALDRRQSGPQSRSGRCSHIRYSESNSQLSFGRKVYMCCTNNVFVLYHGLIWHHVCVWNPPVPSVETSESGDEFLWNSVRIFLRKSNDSHCLPYVLVWIRFNNNTAGAGIAQSV